MAKLPVGYRSPFQKKTSPMRIPWAALAKWAATPGGGAAIGAAIPGVISGISSLFGRKKRRKEQRIARQEMEAARKAYMDMQFVNPLEGIRSPYAGMENPYAENIYEDLTVDRQAADYLREQQQQSQANIMQQMRGAAGGSGVAGLAQQMAVVGSQQARQASATIAQQERQNQMARLRGEQQKRTGTFEFDKMMRKTGFDIDIAKRTAQQQYVTAKEQARTENLFGLSIDRLSAADRARSTARSGFLSGLGQAAAGIGGTFMPGGVNYQGGVGVGGSGAPNPYQGYYPSTTGYTRTPNDVDGDGVPNFMDPDYTG